MLNNDHCKKEDLIKECTLNKVLECQYIVKLHEVVQFVKDGRERLVGLFELMDGDMTWFFKKVQCESFIKFTLF